MLNDTINKILEKLKDEIKKEHPKAQMEFSARDSGDPVELWVYVLSLDDYPSVERQCQRLTKQCEQNTPAVWVFAKTWTGPWPGGESEEDLKKRREQFREEIKNRSG